MFNPETAAIRFGTGLSPNIAPPGSVSDILDRLSETDKMAARFPIDGFHIITKATSEIKRLNKLRRKEPDRSQELRKKVRKIKKKAKYWQLDWLQATIARGVYTDDAMRERLVLFWKDHFTAQGKQGVMKRAMSSYVEDVIRPNVTGKFADMLKAVTFHPMMLYYLDQVKSVGPNSVVAVKKPGRGLNENLAREVLELHTLGVDGAYTQNDVRELAKLFAGLTYERKGGFSYVANMAEPGAETVLGKSYGGNIQDLFHVTDFLDDLAVHPDTARHLAKKLVVHFVSDLPDPELVDHVTAAYLASGGDLMQSYRALLEHPAAWVMPATKVKPPIQFIISSIRALGVAEKTLMKSKPKEITNLVIAPMGLMGQLWENPIGPDGWPEDANHWISPQGLAARIQWAMSAPQQIRRDLPDPRSFVHTALGSRASQSLQVASARAESKSIGVGLILASPEFQRK